MLINLQILMIDPLPLISHKGIPCVPGSGEMLAGLGNNSFACMEFVLCKSKVWLLSCVNVVDPVKVLSEQQWLFLC